MYRGTRNINEFLEDSLLFAVQLNVPRYSLMYRGAVKCTAVQNSIVFYEFCTPKGYLRVLYVLFEIHESFDEITGATQVGQSRSQNLWDCPTPGGGTIPQVLAARLSHLRSSGDFIKTFMNFEEYVQNPEVTLRCAEFIEYYRILYRGTFNCTAVH